MGHSRDERHAVGGSNRTRRLFNWTSDVVLDVIRTKVSSYKPFLSSTSTERMPTTLVTGANGFVAAHVIKGLIDVFLPVTTAIDLVEGTYGCRFCA